MIKQIGISDGTVSYSASGPGAPAALFHQYSAVSADDPLASVLSRHLQVLAINPRGIAGSGPVRSDDDLTMERFAAELHEVRDAMRLPSWIAVGASTGGMVALLHALANPTGVRGLVLIGSAASHRFMSGSLYDPNHPRAKELNDARPLAMGSTEDQKRYAELVFRLSVADPAATPVPPGWAEVEVSMPRMMAFGQHLHGYDVEDLLATITCPTLVMVGRHDPQCPPTNSERIAAGIPNAHLQLFDHSGHFPYLEEPAAFAKALGGWVNDLS